MKSVGVLGHSDDSADFFAALAALGATLDGVINQQSLKKNDFLVKGHTGDRYQKVERLGIFLNI